MKKLILGALSAALMLTMTNCSQSPAEAGITLEDTTWLPEKTITFTFGSRPSTRSTLQEANITDLWLFDYVDGELMNTVHKTSDLDAVTVALEYGEHTLCFVASRGSEPTVSEGVLSWVKPSDTFWASLQIDVQPATSASQSVELNRVATRLSVSITDEIPSNAARLEIEPTAWYYGLNVLTGEAADCRSSVVRPIAIPASYAGTTGLLTATIYGLSPVEAWQTDVSVRLVASDESVLGSVSLSGVSLARNRATVYSGGMMGSGASLSVTVDDEWQDADDHTW